MRLGSYSTGILQLRLSLTAPILGDPSPSTADAHDPYSALIREEQFLAEIEASDSLTDLVDRRSEAISTWKAAQEDLDVEIDIALLDDHWDSDELRRIVAVRLPEMQGLIDLITLNTLLADAAGFYPFPDSQELETDLKRAALGLEKACHRRRG